MLLCTSLRKYFLPKYKLQFQPQQLIYLCVCIENTKDLEGDILEIGCARGRTTIFLNKYMDFAGIEKEYICIDTFGGFTKRDIRIEREKRSKENTNYLSSFNLNSKFWFDETMKLNNIHRVKSLKSDICETDHLEGIGKIAFCLIDLDLFNPVKIAVKKAYPILSPKGIIVVDDCKPNNIWDGAYDAYTEFISKNQLPQKILLDKLGVIEHSPGTRPYSI